MAITYAPRGWHACDGSLLSIPQNSALFSLLGTTYGGNGTQTFALPDLRGRVPVCAGSGPGLSTYVLGQAAGQESTTMTAQNLAPHTHSATLQVTTTGRGVTTVPPATGNFLYTTTTAVPTPPLTALAGVPVGTTGGGVPMPNIQPYLALNYYIALQGLFPSRN